MEVRNRSSGFTAQNCAQLVFCDIELDPPIMRLDRPNQINITKCSKLS